MGKYFVVFMVLVSSKCIAQLKDCSELYSMLTETSCVKLKGNIRYFVENKYECTLFLIDKLTDTAKVTLSEKECYVNITTDLKYSEVALRHQERTSENMLTVNGRANHILREIYGTSIVNVPADYSILSLRKLQKKWIKVYIKYLLFK